MHPMFSSTNAIQELSGYSGPMEEHSKSAFCDCSYEGPGLDKFECYVVYACDAHPGANCDICVCVHEPLLFPLAGYIAAIRT